MKTSGTLRIGNKDIEYCETEVEQNKLQFYPQNPRIYSAMNVDEEIPTQGKIEEFMCKQEHVKTLKESIASNGGLLDPLLVRDGDFVVIEGNSRLAAYRLLNRKDPVKWGKVKCKLLPKTLDDDTIFIMLGQYHIVGRKDWEPYEQANYLYRRTQTSRMPIDDLAKELGLTVQDAKRKVEIVKFMRANNDSDEHHWSYYEEYLKSKEVRNIRKEHPEYDNLFVSDVKDGSIDNSREIRKLAEVSKIDDKQSRKLIKEVVSGEKTIDEAYTEVKNTGKLGNLLPLLKKFRIFVCGDDILNELKKADKNVLNNSKFELNKIITKSKQRVNEIERILEKNENL